MESHCSSINKQGWIRIRNRRCGCGLKAELKISETIDNPNRLLFRCPKGACRFFEWWKVEDDENYFSGNKSEHLTLDGSGIMSDNSHGGRFQRNGVFNSMPCTNYGKNVNESELLLRRLVALEESNGFTKKLMYALFLSLLAVIMIVIVK